MVQRNETPFFPHALFVRSRVTKRLLVAGAVVVLLAISEALWLLPSRSEPNTSYDPRPLPGRWTFSKVPNRTTSHPILVAFRRDWGKPVESLSKVPPLAWRARMTALCALARLGPGAVPVLLEGLDDAEVEIRVLCAQAMGYFGDASQAGRLERVMAEDPEAGVRIYAGISRAMIGGPIPRSLVDLITKHDPVRMTRTRLDLARTRGAEPRSESIREALAGYDLARMDTARPGQPAPDFTLSDQDGRVHRLSDLRGKKAVVLVFINGVTCMYCTGQVANLRARLDRFEAGGAQVLVVESSEPYRIRATLDEARIPAGDLALPVLADPSHTVAATYGVAMQMHHVEWLNRPTSFVIDRDGVLRYAHRGQEVSDRPTTDDLLAQVQSLHHPDPAPGRRSGL